MLFCDSVHLSYICSEKYVKNQQVLAKILNRSELYAKFNHSVIKWVLLLNVRALIAFHRREL